MNRQEIITLMVKKLGKTATMEEEAELKRLLDLYPEEKKWVESEASIKLSQGDRPASYGQEVLKQKNAKLWASIGEAAQEPMHTNPIEKKESIVPFKKWYWAAACLAILLASLVLFYPFSKDDGQLLAQTALGDTEIISLPDGSKVKLNAGSKLYIDHEFNTRNRKVKLIGEAYFQVSKREDLAFLVEAGAAQVEVLGTAFNVKAYPNEQFETTLIQGKVAVRLDQGEKYVLMPLEKLTLETENQQGRHTSDKGIKVSKLPDTTPIQIKEIAWLSNRLIFYDDPFGEVTYDLERKYNVLFKFHDVELRQEKINGVLENESMEEALGLLQRIVAFDFQRKQDTIIIYNQQK